MKNFVVAGIIVACFFAAVCCFSLCWPKKVGMDARSDGKRAGKRNVSKAVGDPGVVRFTQLEPTAPNVEAGKVHFATVP